MATGKGSSADRPHISHGSVVVECRKMSQSCYIVTPEGVKLHPAPRWLPAAHLWHMPSPGTGCRGGQKALGGRQNRALAWKLHPPQHLQGSGGAPEHRTVLTPGPASLCTHDGTPHPHSKSIPWGFLHCSGAPPASGAAPESQYPKSSLGAPSTAALGAPRAGFPRSSWSITEHHRACPRPRHPGATPRTPRVLHLPPPAPRRAAHVPLRSRPAPPPPPPRGAALRARLRSASRSALRSALRTPLRRQGAAQGGGGSRSAPGKGAGGGDAPRRAPPGPPAAPPPPRRPGAARPPPPLSLARRRGLPRRRRPPRAAAAPRWRRRRRSAEPSAASSKPSSTT